MKDQFAVVSWEDISRLKHAMRSDHCAVMGVALDLKKCLQPDTSYNLQQNIVQGAVDYIGDGYMARLARTMDILEEIILKNDRRKTKKPVDSDRRKDKH
jgi:hypothetical protein